VVIGLTALAALVWQSRSHTPKSVLLPGPPHAGPASPVPAPVPAASAPTVAAPPVVAPSAVPAPSSVPEYTGSLKLGLRGLTDASGWSLRLLLIDEANRSTVVPIASGVGPGSGDAVEPEEAFKKSGREPGVVFKDSLQAASGPVEIEVERRPTELVARTRAANGAWSDKVIAKLGADTTIRAAAFSRGRYAEK